MPLWIPVTILAAFMQNLRFLLQRHLKVTSLSTAGATWARFLYSAPLVAVIDEDACIGCALCLPACPVDAILGAHRRMHTVISAECTGCELCIEPCPVDCISLKSPVVLPEW